MAWNKTNIDVFLRRNVLPTVHSNFSNTKPLLWIMVGRDKAELEKLGNPQTGLQFGGRQLMGEATRKVTTGSEKHELVYQKDQTPATSTLDYQATSTPTQSTGFAEDNFGTAEFNWTDYWTPVRFSQHAVDHAEGNRVQVESIVELATMQAVQRHMEKIQTDLVTGTPSSQTTRLWDSLIGMQHTISDGSTDSSSFATYGNVDRTSETELAAIVKDVDTEVSNGDLADTKVRLDLIRKAKIGYGLNKTFAGAGDFVVVGADLFETLAQEAEDRNLRTITGGIPEVGMEGFKLPIIEYGDSLVTFDRDVPDGEMWILTSRSWMMEFAQGANFTLDSGFHQAWREEEGGGYYNWGHFHSKSRLICREPWLQFKYINLTTDGS